MQNAVDDDSIFTSLLTVTPADALNEATAPVADWRFLPQRVGRRQFRIDVAHTETAALPEAHQDETCDTLYFG